MITLTLLDIAILAILLPIFIAMMVYLVRKSFTATLEGESRKGRVMKAEISFWEHVKGIFWDMWPIFLFMFGLFQLLVAFKYGPKDIEQGVILGISGVVTLICSYPGLRRLNSAATKGLKQTP